MLGSTAICSAVPAVGLAPSLLPLLGSFKLDRQQAAIFCAEHLRGMTARKRAIAPLPQALTR
jgi:hypothetical protein